MLRIIPAAIAAFFMSNANAAAQMWCLNETTQCSYGTPSLSKLSQAERNASIYKMTVAKYNEAVDGNAFQAITANELIRLAKEYLAPTPTPTPTPSPTPVPTPTPTPTPDEPLDFTKLDKCADKGGDGCWFGTETDRTFYLVSGDKYEKKQTNGWGTSCLVNTDYGFPSTKISTNDDATCYVEKGDNPAPSPTPVPTPTPTPTPVPTPTPTDPPHNHDMMPFVDTSKYMTPQVGSGELKIITIPESWKQQWPETYTTRPDNDTGGAFRVTGKASHMNNDDPIIYPNQPGKAHSHTWFCNTKGDAFSTFESLKSTGNSTCQGGIANRSAYWLPSLIDTTDGTPLVPSWAIFYYKGGQNRIPNGLMMIAGDHTATEDNPQDDTKIYWSCNASARGSAAYFERKNYILPCSGDLMATVAFPNCWDGKRLNTPNGKDHMAYGNNGSCPATHPVNITNVTANIHYNVPNTNNLRLSSDNYMGGAGGYSLHFDYMFAWDEEILKAWQANCIGKKQDCHAGLLGDGRYLQE